MFNFSPDAGTTQTLVTIAGLSLALIPLDNLAVSVSNLAIRTDGFSFDNLTTTVDTLSIGDILELSQATLSFSNVDYTDTTGSLTGTITVSSSTATFFPGKSFHGSATALSGSYDIASQDFSISAATLHLADDGFFTGEASNVTFGYSPNLSGVQTLATLGSLNLTIEPLNNLNVDVQNLVITTDGFSFDSLTTTVPDLTVGSFLVLANPTIAFTAFSYVFSTNAATGTITLSSSAATLFPGKSFHGSITDLSGSYDIASQAFSISAATLHLADDGFFTGDATNVTFGYSPNLTGVQTLATLGSLNLTVEPLNDLNVDVQNLVITTDGFSFDSLTTTVPDLTVGSFLDLTNPTIAFSAFSYVFSTNAATGTITLSSVAATLFPGKSFHGSITDLSGSYDIASQDFSISASTLHLTDDGFFTGDATNVTFGYSPNLSGVQTLATLGSLDLTVEPLNGLEVTVKNLAIRNDGFSFDDLTAAVASLSIGSVFTLTNPTVDFTNVNFTTTTNELSGSFGISAQAAAMLPGQSFSGTITSPSPNVPALTGSFDPSTGAFSLTASALALQYPDLFDASATNVTLSYDPSLSGTQTLLTLATLNLDLQPLNGLSVAVTNLAIRNDGFSFDDLTTQVPGFSVGTFLSVSSPTIGFSNVYFSTGTESTPAGFAGTFHFLSNSARLFPGRSFNAALSPTDTIPAVAGTLNLTTLAFQITTGNFDLNVGTALEVTGSGAILEYDPTNPAEQTLAIITSAMISAPEFNVTGSLSEFTLTTGGFSIGSGSITSPTTRTLGSAADPILILDGVTVAFTDFSVRFGSNFSIAGTLQISSPSATVFPNSTVFTASATNIAGGFSFSNGGVSNLSLTLGTFQLDVGQSLSVSATNLLISPDGDVIASVASLTASIPALQLSGMISDFQIYSDGSVDVAGFTLNSNGFAKTIGLGGFLPVDINSISVNFLTNASGRHDLTNFNFTVSGTLDNTIFSGLPFTPVVKIGSQSYGDSTSSITFTARLDHGSLTPLDVGPISLGITGLHIGPLTLGGELILGGYAEGAFVPEVGGLFSVTSSAFADTILVIGTLNNGLLSLHGENLLSFTMFGGKLVLKNADVSFGLKIGNTSSGFVFQPSIGKISVGLLSINLMDFMSFQAKNVKLDFGASGSQPLISFGGASGGGAASSSFNPNTSPDGSLSAIFGSSAGLMKGWGGEVGNFAIGADGSFELLPGFSVTLHIGGSSVGLPSFLPVYVTKVGIKFNPDAIVNGTLVHPEDFTIVASGGVNSLFPLIPFAGAFADLQLNVQTLLSDPDPFDAIENLGGFEIGIPRMELGEVEIEGKMAFGKVTENGKSSFYLELEGKFFVAGFGGGIDIAFCQYGPLIATLSGGGTDPVTGLMFDFENVGFIFGQPGFPSITDPQEIFTNVAFQNPTELTLSQLTSAVSNAVAAGVPTFVNGFEMVGGVRISDLYAAGVVSGEFTIAANIGLSGANTGLKILAKGTGTVFGFPVASIGMLFDDTDILAPKVYFAFVMPDPSSPLSFLFPDKVTVVATLKTDGVITLPIVALSTFFTEVSQGVLAEGQALFSTVIAQMASDAEADHGSNLSQILLDTNNVFDGGRPVVTDQENLQVITTAFFESRVLSILTPNFSDLADFNRLTEATSLVINLLPTLIIDGTALVANNMGEIIADLAPIFVKAGVNAIVAGYNQFNPSLSIEALIQPTIFGMPIGSPTQKADLEINKHGISFGYTGSIEQLIVTIAARGILIPTQFLGLNDLTEFDVTLPFPEQFFTSLITGTSPIENGASLSSFIQTAVSATSGWQIYLSTSLQALGTFNLATATGYIFGPQPIVDGAYVPTTLFASKVVNLDPNNTGKPDPVLKHMVDNTPGLIGVDSSTEYAKVEEYGGILFSATLSLPDFIEDPVAWVESSLSPNIWTSGLPVAPTGVLDVQGEAKLVSDTKAYIAKIEAFLTEQTTWGTLNFYIPGLLGLVTDPGAAYVEGYSDLKIFGLHLGETKISMDTRQNPNGTYSRIIDASLSIPWMAGLLAEAQLEETLTDPAILVQGLIDSPFISTFVKPVLGPGYDGLNSVLNSMKGIFPPIPLPGASFTASVSLTRMEKWFVNSLGLPAILFQPSSLDATASIGFYTPGFDQTAAWGSVKHDGGMVVDAGLNIVGIVDNAKFHFEIEPFQTNLLGESNLASLAVEAGSYLLTGAYVPNFLMTASVDHLGLPNLPSVGKLLSLDGFLISITKETGSLSMDLAGDLWFLNEHVTAEGKLRISPEGLWGSLIITTNGDVGYGPVKFGGIFTVDINSTPFNQQGFQGTIPFLSANIYANAHMDVFGLVASGTFQFRASPLGGLLILADVQAGVGPLGYIHFHGDMSLTNAGLVAKIYAASTTDLGVLKGSGELALEINTTLNEAEGIPAGTFEYLYGSSISLLDVLDLEGQFIFVVGPSGLSVAANALVDIPIFGNMSAIGGFNIDSNGLSGALVLSIANGALSGNAFGLTGNFQLEFNTGPSVESIKGFTVDPHTGNVTLTQTLLLDPFMVSLDVGGSLSVGGVFVIKGEFSGKISSAGMILDASATMSVFNVTASVHGHFAFLSDGLVVNAGITIPTFGVPGLFDIGATSLLQINSRPVSDDATGLASGTYVIGLYDAHFHVLGIGLSVGYASMGVKNGVWFVDVKSPGIEFDLGPLNFHLYGYLRSDGSFSLTSGFSFGIDLFPFISFGVNGQATLSNSGFQANFSGYIDGYYWGPPAWKWPWDWSWHRFGIGPVSGSLIISGSGIGISLAGHSLYFGDAGYTGPAMATTSVADPVRNPAPSVLFAAPTTATEGEPVYITAQGVAPGKKLGVNPVTYFWKVIGPDDKILTTGSGTGDPGTPYSISFVPPTSGNYKVQVSAVAPRYFAKTTSTTTVSVSTVVNDFSFTGDSQVYGTASNVTVTGPTDAQAGLKYSYDFNNDGSFTDPGDIANSTSSQASFIFPHPGSYTVHVKVADSLGTSSDYYTTVIVNTAPLTERTSQALAALTGISTTQEVAIVADPNVGGNASLVNATINWGNGHTSSGYAVALHDGRFAIYGTNTYGTTGTFDVKVTLKDSYGGTTTVPSQSITVTTAPQLVAKSILTTAGGLFSGQVASFTTIAGFAAAGAVINWGDGTTSDGTIVAGGLNSESVFGSHVYLQGGNYTPTVNLIAPGFGIAAGGTAVDGYLADTNYSGGSPVSTFETIDTSKVINPAPQAVYQAGRTGDFTYTIPNLNPGGTYEVRLHFADPVSKLVGQRVFNVAINGDLILRNFDIFTVSGGQDEAYIAPFVVTADANGQIAIQFTSITGLALVSGIEIDRAVSSITDPATAYDAPLTITPVDESFSGATASGVIATITDPNIYDTAGDFTATINWGDGISSPGVIAGGNGTFTISGGHQYDAVGTYQPTVLMAYIAGYGIAAGGTLLSSNFVPDTGFQGGSTTTTSALIKTGFTPFAAPTSVYQSQRFGDFSYTIPNLSPGSTYDVRLDFAETYFNRSGQRLFNVGINGIQVLTGLDVYAAAGGAKTSFAQTFLTTADAGGNVTITFTSLRSLAMVSGIEVVPAVRGSSTLTVGGNQLTIIQQPAAATAGVVLAPVTFRILDSDGNPTTSSRKVSISASGSGDFAPGSTITVYAVDGYATFENLILDKSGNYTLTATAIGVEPATTNTFAINPSADYSLVFLQAPTVSTAGTAINPSVTVIVEDMFGNQTTSTASVTISDNGPGGFDSVSTLTVNAVDGLATFSNLILDTSGNYTLSASSNGLAGLTTHSFRIVPAVASQLVFSLQPAGGVAGTVLPSTVVRLEDVYGNLTPSRNIVTIAASGPGGFASGSTLSVAADAGVATFSNLVLNATGIYIQTVSMAGAANADSSEFTITPASATHLRVTQSPASGTAGFVIGPVVVILLDIFNNISSSNSSVTINANGPGGFSSSSTTTVSAVNGVVTFSNLTLPVSGSYTFTLTSNGLTGTFSSTLSIVAANFVVTTLTDALDGGNEITLRQAITTADIEQGSPTISFAPGLSGTIVLNSALGALSTFTSNITIQGPGASLLTIDGGQVAGNSIFTIGIGSTSIISGVTLTHGSATNGGAISNAGMLTVVNSLFTSNVATVGGGAIYTAPGSTLAVTGSAFSNNTAISGGAIWDAGIATLTSDTFTVNSATQGGAIFDSGVLTLVSDTIASNFATTGGGIGTSPTAPSPTLKNTIVANNSGLDIAMVNPSPYANALTFNGSTGFVQLPSQGFANFTSGFSAGIWVYPTNVASGERFFDFGNGTANDNILLARSGSSNDLVFIVYGGGPSSTAVYASNVIELNKWQYFSVVEQANGSTTLSKNGVVVGTGSTYLPNNINRSFNYVAKSNWTVDGYYGGQMNSFSVWNIPLSSVQIQTMMNTPPAGTETGLVGYWSMNEGTGSTVYDISPNHLNGTISGPTPSGLASTAVIQPTITSALAFNGANQYVQLPSAGLSNFTNGFSFGVWSYPTAANSNARFLDIGNGAGSDNILFYRFGGSNDLIFQVLKGGSSTYLYVPNALTLNTWQYLSVTQSASGAVTIYKNGLPIATGTVQIANNITRTTNYIGRSNWGDPYYAGLMENASIWNVGLSAAQVQTAMNNGIIGNEAGLVSYYPMTTSTVSGTTLTDQSTNHNNATLFNNLAIAAFPALPYSTVLSFNGQSNYVQLPSTALANFTNGFSAGIWVNTSAVTSYQRFFDFGNGANTDNILLERGGVSDDLVFYIFKGGSAYSLVVPNVLVTNQWQYLSVTQNASGLVTLYAGGLAVGSATLPLPNIINRTFNYVGKSNFGDQDSNALMNGFSVWNIGLTAAQVQSAMTNGLTGSESGLVGYWPMNETNGTTVYDLSPNKLNGSMNGYGIPTAAVTTAKFASNLIFNGTSSSYVQLPSSGLSDFTNGFSFGVWAYPTYINGFQRFFDIGNGAASDNIFLSCNGSSNDLLLEIFKSGSGYILNASNALVLNAWQYISVTQSSAGVVTMYINGVSVATSTLPVPNNITRVTNYIGKSNWGDPNYVGQMSAASFWNVAITPSQIQSVMTNGLNGNESGLVSYYPMTTATVSGTTLLDSSPNHNNAGLDGYTATPPINPAPKFSSDLNFIGTNGYVQLPSAGLSNFTNGFSFGVWANATQMNGSQRFFDIGNGANSDNILLSRNGSSNDLVLEIFKGGSGSSLNASNVLVLNTWQYIAVTQTAAGVVTIYVNGVPVATSTLPVPNNITRNSNYIGKSN